MAFDELLAEKVRVYFLSKNIENREIKMMGGLCFMVDEKMCLGVLDNAIMARIDPEIYDSCLEINGCTEMRFTGRAMKGFVFVNLDEVDEEYNLKYWVELCLEYNPKAKASRKRKKKDDN